MQNKFIPLEHYTFDQIENFDDIITNLKTSLVNNNKLDQNEWDALMNLKYHINSNPDPNNVITDSCIDAIRKYFYIKFKLLKYLLFSRNKKKKKNIKNILYKY